MPKVSVNRRLAAIMFTDIVGYTRLMGDDEDLAFNTLRKNRKIHKAYIEKYNGEWLKEMGDGILASFQTSSEAVRCANEIQVDAKKEGIPIRIGIHVGEVIYESGDVFGEGVNIASRIQASANAGCINISESVFKDIKNKKDIITEYSGDTSFKNVNEPVKVYQIKKVKLGNPTISSSPKSGLKRPFVKVMLSLSISVIAITAFYLFYSGTSLPFNERGWIVITNFENTTGEEIFDHSLNTAFFLSISESRYINVITQQRMIEALKRMKLNENTFIDGDIGQKIAVRENADLCIIPGISKVGNRYILTAKIQNPRTTEIFSSKVLYVNSKNVILRKLDKLSAKVRRTLGESNFRIFNNSKPLSRVTTTSFEALKEFSLGIDDHWKLKFEKARKHYENAISIDSSFTSAKASLGNLLVQKFDPEKGKYWLEEAIHHIDNLTDKEKYGILAFYASNVENDLDKAIEYMKIRLDLYPDDPTAHNNLGWYYQNSELYEKAIQDYKAALKIDPHLMLAYSGLLWIYLGRTGNIDSAYTWSKRMIDNGPDSPWGYFYLGSAYVAMDKLEKAKQQYIKVDSLDSDLTLNKYRLAHTFRLMGNYRNAIEILKEILDKDPNEVPAIYNIGVNYQLQGDSVTAREYFTQYLINAKKWEETYPDNPLTYLNIGLVYTQLGEFNAGLEIGNKGIALDSTIHFNIAQFMTIQGRKKEALDQLELALKHGNRNLAWIKLNPDLFPLQSDPRFQSLISKYFSL